MWSTALFSCRLAGFMIAICVGVNDEIKAFAADESMCVEFKGSAAEPKRIVPCLENGPDGEPRLTPAFREALQRFIDRWSATA